MSKEDYKRAKERMNKDKYFRESNNLCLLKIITYKADNEIKTIR